MEKHPLHLKIPDLQTSEEVSDAVAKQERLTNETIPNDPNERIEAYMSRLENIFLNPDERVKERNLEMLRPAIYDAFIIKPEQVSESYFELQQQVARERGQPVEVIPPEVRKQMIDILIEDQKHSLDQWLDYLTSDDVAYPTWFKYFVFRNITKLSQFDKTLGKFKTRTETTVAPYPDIYRAPLAKILDIYEQVAKDNNKLKTLDIQTTFSKKFPKLYAELISESLAVNIEGKEQVKGEWIKYNKGDRQGADALYESMQAKGTGWCVEGQTIARNYINQGDFYVYYTYDKNGQPIQPRIAIQMNDSQIGQIRGILSHQELEPIMSDILDEKLKDFGSEADSYKKKNVDMKHLTEIDHKTTANKPLTKDDLLFLYEVNSVIEGFGYDKDPRITEIRNKRNLQEDLPVLFDCTPNQIALRPEDLNQNSVAYIGSWSPEVFKKLPKTITHVYESFPDKKVFLKTIETDSAIKTPVQAKKELLNKGIKFYGSAEEILQKVTFSKENKEYNLVSFSVESLGFPNGATTKEIYDKAESLGLEICPAEVGPLLRLNYLDQPNNTYLVIAMKSILASDGSEHVFGVDHSSGELDLYARWDYPDRRWDGSRRFVFLRRK